MPTFFPQEVTTQQKQNLFITLWHLAAALLFAGASIASFSEVKGTDVSIGYEAISLENVTSLHHLQQKERHEFPGLPGKRWGSEYVENEEENKENESGGDNYFKQAYRLNFAVLFYPKNYLKVELSAKFGGKQLPLFLLFHCWRSFLA